MMHSQNSNCKQQEVHDVSGRHAAISACAAVQVERALCKRLQLENFPCRISTSVITIPRPFKSVASELPRLQAAAILQEAHQQRCSGVRLHVRCT